jgi:hypothetical protein
MRLIYLYLAILLLFSAPMIRASDADDNPITIQGSNAGSTPFLSQLDLSINDPSVIQSITFTVVPKAGSVTRPLSATYSADYLSDRGDLQDDGQIYLPLYGLYPGYANTVALTYRFVDGSESAATTAITTAPFDDPCGYDMPTVLQARTSDTTLSYDYMMVKGRCETFSPAIIDTDGALRWVGPAGISNISATLYQNSIFIASGTKLYRLDFDGTVTFLHDYADIGVTFIHHNIDRGKYGLILDVNTTSYFESTNLEVDASGNVLKTWDMAQIISAAMTAGGDDPAQFVYPTPTDWFHNNAVCYNRADDSVIISSRENFVICLDYTTNEIKWILGDPTKKWHQFPSLAQFALSLGANTLPPIGQHSVSITFDQALLLYDNGARSFFQQPLGAGRPYSSPRKYEVDLETMTATEVWNYEMDQSIFTYICGSVYEDAPYNYLIDYSYVPDLTGGEPNAQLLGINADGEKVFYYQYGPTNFCDVAFNSIPLHLEKTAFPAVGPQILNLSTRGMVSSGDDTLIGGLIITGANPKRIALRALGPSLSDSGLTGTVADPTLTLYDSSGAVLVSNDDWASDPSAIELSSDGLAPDEMSESATVQNLAPGAYTVVVTNKAGTLPGLGLVEAYDLAPTSTSEIGNLSTRGLVGADDSVLISGFIVGEVENTPMILRALGPSLPLADLGNPLPDPVLTIYDQNGSTIAANDDWQDDINFPEVQKHGLAPTDAAESAIALNPPAGAYTAIVSSASAESGISLVEVFALQ